MTQATQAPTKVRAQIASKTLRQDQWWRVPAFQAAVLGAVVVYLTWASLVNKDYFAAPYISPLYSPCLVTNCVKGSGFHWIPWLSWLAPAVLIIGGPMGFRLTCYYYRKAYYRAFWQSPTACAVREPHAKYTGETRIPLILQNLHRYFFYLALIFNVILTADAVVAFRNAQGAWAQALLQASGQVQGLDAGLEAERQAHGVRLDLAWLRLLHRPVHPAGRGRRLQRPELLLRCQTRHD